MLNKYAGGVVGAVLACCSFIMGNAYAAEPVLTENSVDNLVGSTYDEFIGDDGKVHGVTLHSAYVDSGDGMIVVEEETGHYRLNYTGASAGWTEGYGSKTIAIQTGASHALGAEFEDNSNGFGNTSGAKINITEGARIKKAYLAIEFGEDQNQFMYRYPVTLYHASDKGQAESDSKNEFYVSDYAFTVKEETGKLSSYNYLGWVDVTDYVQTYGTGWYYAANIPIVETNGGDWSADWKLVVVEESDDFPYRQLKLEFGAAAGTGHEWSEYMLETSEMLAKTEGKVGGQVLYGMTDIDTGAGYVQIGVDVENGMWPNIVSVNGARTAERPLDFIKTINTEPLEIDVNYAFETTYHTLNDGRQITQTGADMELLEIGDLSKHNVEFVNGADTIGWRFNPTDCVLSVHVLGLTVDVDDPDDPEDDYLSVKNPKPRPQKAPAKVEIMSTETEENAEEETPVEESVVENPYTDNGGSIVIYFMAGGTLMGAAVAGIIRKKIRL